MDNFFLLLLGSISLAALTGLMITLYGIFRAPVGFQHQDLFYYGNPPAGLIPLETGEVSPHQGDWL